MNKKDKRAGNSVAYVYPALDQMVGKAGKHREQNIFSNKTFTFLAIVDCLFFHFYFHLEFNIQPGMPLSTAGSLGNRASETSTPQFLSNSRRTSPSQDGG